MALRLVFWIPKGPDGVSGQYESMEGTAQLAAVDRDHVAGAFDATFVQQHSDTSFKDRGSFDFRRAR